MNSTHRVQSVPSLREDVRYRHRRQRAYNRVQALGLKRRWIARQIGRSLRCVTEVLRGTDTGEPTLILIEVLLHQIESGEVVVPSKAKRRGR